MTKNEMLRHEVARRLAAGGHASDYDAVEKFETEVRQDISAVLTQAAASMARCQTPHGDCRCAAATVLYEAHAGAILRGEAA